MSENPASAVLLKASRLEQMRAPLARDAGAPGMDDFVAKPVDRDWLYASLLQWLEVVAARLLGAGRQRSRRLHSWRRNGALKRVRLAPALQRGHGSWTLQRPTTASPA